MWDYFSYDAESKRSVCQIAISGSVCGKCITFYTECIFFLREEALKKRNVEIQVKKGGTSLMYYQSTLKEAFTK